MKKEFIHYITKVGKLTLGKFDATILTQRAGLKVEEHCIMDKRDENALVLETSMPSVLKPYGPQMLDQVFRCDWRVRIDGGSNCLQTT